MSRDSARKCQYSLRVLFGTCVGITLLLGWIALPIHQARKQAKTVSEIRARGGKVVYSFQRDDGFVEWQGETVHRGFVRQLVGPDLQSTVIALEFAGADLEDTSVYRLKDIEELYLSECLVTPTLFHWITQQRKLRVLVLCSSRWTKQIPFGELRQLTSLEVLSLRGTPVCNPQWSVFRSIKRLQELDVSGTGITDAGLLHLSHLTRLKKLNVSDNPVTNGALSSLCQLESLEYLWMEGTHVSDEGLWHLQNLRNLTLLNLDGTNVTGEGLLQLETMDSLGALTIRRIQISRSEVERIQSVLPNLQINR